MGRRKWTPGPWVVKGERGIRGANGECVASTYVDAPSADAHLIAAAPDLYEALAELITDAEVAINIPASAYAAMRKALGQA